jgi:hypothetical protein
MTLGSWVIYASRRMWWRSFLLKKPQQTSTRGWNKIPKESNSYLHLSSSICWITLTPCFLRREIVTLVSEVWALLLIYWSFIGFNGKHSLPMSFGNRLSLLTTCKPENRNYNPDFIRFTKSILESHCISKGRTSVLAKDLVWGPFGWRCLF